MTGVAAIRGAVQAGADTAAAIESATRELLEAILERNRLDPAGLVAVWFTQTPDLTAMYPAEAARRMGWTTVPLLCAQEAAVADALPRTIRAMVLASAAEGHPRHVYLGAARVLRPDLVEGDPEGTVEAP